MAETLLPCGCDPMAIENAESCKRCDDDECQPNGCERLQAMRLHWEHVKPLGFFGSLIRRQRSPNRSGK